MQIAIAPWAVDESGSTAALAPLVAQARLADRLGFHSLWLPESHFQARGSNPAPLLLLAAIAAQTERIRLGTTSYLLTIRHPLLVAEEVAVLDRLSGGRLILGVGRGFRAELFDAFDVPRTGKRDRFEAALATMIRAWSGEPLLEPPQLKLTPLPVQKPHPPIWVAAFGPKALAQAGRLGLPYLASPMEPIDRLLENYARHREALAPSAPTDLEVPIMRTMFVTPDAVLADRVRAELLSQAQAIATSGLAALRMPAVSDPDEWTLVGTQEKVLELAMRYREKLGVTHMIARAQVPGATPGEVERSIHALAELAQSLAHATV